jgi:hypothetical protein
MPKARKDALSPEFHTFGGAWIKTELASTHRNADISISVSSDSRHFIPPPTRASLQKRPMGAIRKVYSRTAGFLDKTPGNVMHPQILAIVGNVFAHAKGGKGT